MAITWRLRRSPVDVLPVAWRSRFHPEMNINQRSQVRADTRGMERTAAGETGSQLDSTPESSGPERPEIAADIHYDEKVFGPDGVFGSRGLGTEEGRKVVWARPHVPYEQGESGYTVVLDPKWWGWQLTDDDQ